MNALTHLTACCGLMLLTLAGLPHRTARAEEPAKGGQTFELLVLGPDGKPVPEASVEIRTNPTPTAEQFSEGKFVRKGAYGAFATTDAQGRLLVRLPRAPKNFDVNITTPGYGPYWASWSSEISDQPVPDHFTAELEAGWSVGGIVVDSEGKPIEGVTVHPSIEFKKRPGDTRQFGVGTNLKTDAAGKWRYDSVPASKSQVSVEISDSSFRPNRQPLTRSEFGIERGQEPAAKIELDRGLTVTGLVTDEAGKPIAGALIRTKFLNDLREAKTGDDGVYLLGGCETRTARIVVSAKGWATDMKEVRVEPEMEPVDFVMKPGATVRIRVLDEHDEPIPKARIFFQRWRGRYEYFEFNHVSQYANAQGVWEWHEAPVDGFAADICRPDGMQLSKEMITPRAQEYVFRPPPALVVSGKVIDAATKQPIPKFRVLPGSRDSSTIWFRGQEFTATDGTYRFRQTYDSSGHLVRIEAEGYQPAVSRDIKSNEGNVTIDFELAKGKDVAATVLTPDGRPAAGAKVALGVAQSQISVKNGDIDASSTYCARQETNDSGQFRFPPQDTAYQLVITHPAGYAHVHGTPEMPPDKIPLEAWARVEGTFRIGKETVSNVPITLNTSSLHSYGKDVPSIFTHYDVATGKDGGFVFERVLAGQARLGRRIRLHVRQGAQDVTSSCMLPASFAAGEATRIDLGGAGRPAIGRLKPPAGFNGKINWHFAMVEVEAYLPEPPKPNDPPVPAEVEADPARKTGWLLNWERTTNEGRAWMAWRIAAEANERLRDASPRFSASVDLDGSFRIDDMPAGNYGLSVWFSQEGAVRLRDHRFTVEPMEGNRSDRPLDLGVLALE